MASIRTYLSGLRFAHVVAGFPDPGLSALPVLHYVLRGINRSQPSPTSHRLPVTPQVLQLLFTAWSASEAGDPCDCSMLWAACCMGFFGFMRSGEFTCPSLTAFQDHMLSPRDISVDSHTHPTVVSVYLRRSKCDPFARGVVIHLGRTAHMICPVSAVLSYLGQRGMAHGPLFLFRDATCLSRQRLVLAVWAALESQGVDPTIWFHGTQFSYWGSNSSIFGRSRGFLNPNAWQVAVIRLSSIYSYPS